MIPVLTPQAMREADAAGIKELGLSSLQLMENAARSTTDIVHRLVPSGTSVVVLCGTGNNGGDGFAMARMLCSTHAVRVAWIGDPERMTAETSHEYAACVEAGVPCVHLVSEEAIASQFLEPVACIIDALIGIGGSCHLRGLVVPLLRHVNALSCMRIAVDVPTGLDAGDGTAHEECFAAHHTITMAAPKYGHYLRAGKDVCGSLHVASIGLTDTIITSRASVFAMERQDVSAMLAPRKNDTSKFDYGRICIIAGSRDMPGAAALCANAAIRSGAGMVEVCSTVFHPHMLPEVLQTHLPSTVAGTIAREGIDRLRSSCQRADCIVIGPGAGTHAETLSVMSTIIAEFGDTKPVIVDADALRALPDAPNDGSRVIVTPHAGEFARMQAACETSGYRISTPEEMASYHHCLVVAKGIPVRITDGTGTIWNVNGNPGMATAGSGDVAAGVIAAMICRSSTLPMLLRVAAGVFIHAAAGDIAAVRYTQEGVTASRIISTLHLAFHDIARDHMEGAGKDA
ncbi:MAG: NAD(P)H-hydrate dehydratase [Candidatus Kapaibacterium sp.]